MSTKQYSMLINTTRCVGCQTCVVSCKISRQISGDVSWCRVVTNGSKDMYRPTGKFPNPVLAFQPLLCNHCADPACTKNCPTGAMRKDDDGIVAVDQKTCIGCGNCVRSCPYGVPTLDLEKKVSQKCDFCKERIGTGELPYCVESCPAEARIFGVISDVNGEFARLVAAKRAKPLMPEFGTKPSVYYL